jgi:zinc protease
VTQPVKTFNASLTWLGPSTVGPGLDLTFAADVFSEILHEPSSRFQRDLVDSGACLGAALDWKSQRNTGPITYGLEAEPEKADACIQAALNELERMDRSDFFTEEELTNARHRLLVERAEEAESSSGYAHLLTFWWASAGLDYYQHYLENTARVTQPDIARYLRTFVLGQPYVFGVMVSPEMVAQGLDEPHFERLIGVGGARASRSSP